MLCSCKVDLFFLSSSHSPLSLPGIPLPASFPCIQAPASCQCPEQVPPYLRGISALRALGKQSCLQRPTAPMTDFLAGKEHMVFVSVCCCCFNICPASSTDTVPDPSLRAPPSHPANAQALWHEHRCLIGPQLVSVVGDGFARSLTGYIISRGVYQGSQQKLQGRMESKEL